MTINEQSHPRYMNSRIAVAFAIALGMAFGLAPSRNLWAQANRFVEVGTTGVRASSGTAYPYPVPQWSPLIARPTLAVPTSATYPATARVAVLPTPAATNSNMGWQPPAQPTVGPAVVQQTASTLGAAGTTATPNWVARVPQGYCAPCNPVGVGYPQNAAAQAPGMVYPPAAGAGCATCPTPGYAPVGYPATRTGYTPLLPIFPMPAGTYLGQGIIGQPTAYVPSQPLRNLLRYIFP